MPFQKELRGLGGGAFASPALVAQPGTTSFISIADLDKDGHADLVVADPVAKTISVRLGQGDFTFAAPTSYAVPGTVYGIASD